MDRRIELLTVSRNECPSDEHGDGTTRVDPFVGKHTNPSNAFSILRDGQNRVGASVHDVASVTDGVPREAFDLSPVFLHVTPSCHCQDFSQKLF
jgi:hypothetical protein